MRFLPYTVVYLFIPTPDVGLAITVIFLLNTLNQHYTHSNIRLPFQKQLEFIFVTPRFHFVHHISTRMHTDSNYGFVFSFWDRIFGTYTNPDEIDNNAPMGLDYEISNLRLLLGIPGTKVQKQSKDPEDNILGKRE
jgi:sterol desaturase/sphingolipid hydroxylase (fatty acid hydroxylase superfamily)